MIAIEDQIEKIQDESEATRDESYPPDTTGERPGRSRWVVQSVRLPTDEFAEIEELARAADVPLSALIRGWVLAGLAEDRMQPWPMPSDGSPPTWTGSVDSQRANT